MTNLLENPVFNNQAMYVIATFCCDLSPLLLGFVLDIYGPRACSILALICVTSGFLIFSASNIVTAPYFTIAISLIAFGGTGNQIAL